MLSLISVLWLFLYRCEMDDTNTISFVRVKPQQALSPQIHGSFLLSVVSNNWEGKELLLWIQCKVIVLIVRHKQLSRIWWHISLILVYLPYLKKHCKSGFITTFLSKSWLFVEHMLIIPQDAFTKPVAFLNAKYVVGYKKGFSNNFVLWSS